MSGWQSCLLLFPTVEPLSGYSTTRRRGTFAACLTRLSNEATPHTRASGCHRRRRNRASKLPCARKEEGCRRCSSRAAPLPHLRWLLPPLPKPQLATAAAAPAATPGSVRPAPLAPPPRSAAATYRKTRRRARARPPAALARA
eukprot:scaffold185_cov321-Prasinococcus_capsulatus_cf.AAC.9